MCEWLDVHEAVKDQGLLDTTSPPIGVKKGHCADPSCGRLLHQFELKPAGKCSRAWCDACYNKHWAGVIHNECAVCHTPIPDKVTLQRQNPREIVNHLCNNPMCHAIVSLFFGVVHGRELSYEERFGTPGVALPNNQSAPQIQTPLKTIPHDDVMDAEYVVHNANTPRLESPFPQLPPPTPHFRVPDFVGTGSTNYKDDGVLVVELAKRKRKKWL